MFKCVCACVFVCVSVCVNMPRDPSDTRWRCAPPLLPVLHCAGGMGSFRVLQQQVRGEPTTEQCNRTSVQQNICPFLGSGVVA